MIKKCFICKKEFKIKPSHFRKRRCCSKKCDNEFRRLFFKGNKTSFKKGHPAPKTAFKKGQFSGKNHYHWKGGRFKTFNGYILVYQPNHPFCNKNKYIYEHRYNMEKYLNRILNPKEVVHHLNKNKSDNKIENLKLFSSDIEHHLIAHSKL